MNFFVIITIRNDCKHFFVYEISVFARGLNSTMKMSMAFSWPENVPTGNPYSRSEFKYIEFFCIIFFELHQYRATFWLVKSIPLADFGPFWSKFWAVSKKVAGRTLYTVAGDTPNSQDIFFGIERVSHNNI